MSSTSQTRTGGVNESAGSEATPMVTAVGGAAGAEISSMGGSKLYPCQPRHKGRAPEAGSKKRLILQAIPQARPVWINFHGRVQASACGAFYSV